jgi:hypothetical protein
LKIARIQAKEGVQQRAACLPARYAGRVLVNAFNSDGNWTGPIENRNVTGHSAEYDNSRLRDAAVAIVDHEVIGTPESQCTGRKIKLSLDRGQCRRQIAGLFLP